MVAVAVAVAILWVSIGRYGSRFVILTIQSQSCAVGTNGFSLVASNFAPAAGEAAGFLPWARSAHPAGILVTSKHTRQRYSNGRNIASCRWVGYTSSIAARVAD